MIQERGKRKNILTLFHRDQILSESRSGKGSIWYGPFNREEKEVGGFGEERKKGRTTRLVIFERSLTTTPRIRKKRGGATSAKSAEGRKKIDPS